MKTYQLAFWNVENLFAPENHPDRPDWIRKRLGNSLVGWTDERFTRKIAQLASIIAKMNEGAGPDLLGVCEVENLFTLEQLVAALAPLLPDRAYQIVHSDSEADKRGIDTAFLFDSARLSVDPDLIFSHFVMRRTGTRDILQATFHTQSGHAFVALANHWPSRLHSPHSGGFRATAGETLSYWHARIIEETGDRMPVIAMGDFNDDPWDPSLTVHARATRERGDVRRSRTAKFFNLTHDYLTQAAVDKNGKNRTLYGTLYYGSNGNVFDQILIGRGFLLTDSPLQVIDGSARIDAFPEMTSHRVGEGPIRFGLPDGNPDRNLNLDGYSDHFPVSVRIEESKGLAVRSGKRSMPPNIAVFR